MYYSLFTHPCNLFIVQYQLMVMVCNMMMMMRKKIQITLIHLRISLAKLVWTL
jgi:hypothetical protein